jgi:polar amino acid transport system ATP-binding protein
MIEVEALRKSYGEVAILSDVAFSVARGEVLAVIGSSGSGKSTLLRCITFLEEFERGRILIDGAPVGYEPSPLRRRLSAAAVAETRSRVGMVFQSFNLFPHKTALDNVTPGPFHVKRQHRANAEK